MKEENQVFGLICLIFDFLFIMDFFFFTLMFIFDYTCSVQDLKSPARD